VTETLASASMEGAPTEAVIAKPLACTIAPATMLGVPRADVIATPVGEALAAAVTEREPIPDVIAWPVGSTGKTLFHAPWPHVPLPQPLMLAIN
jgi:hypothetical protein